MDERLLGKRKCPICGGNLEEGTTTYTVDLEFGLVVVKMCVSARPEGECKPLFLPLS